MKIELNYQNSVISLPGAVIEKLATASEQDLKVLLCAAADAPSGAEFDAAKLAVRLDIPEREVENALSFWRGAGVLKTLRSSKKRAKEEPAETAETSPAPLTMQTGTPSYTGSEIEEIMKKRKRLGQLLEECQKILDRVFNVAESNLVIALCDVLHLDDDYILLLSSWCMNKNEKGVTMKYVYNTAYRLFEDDVLTVQQLEEYIAREESQRDFENYMRKLLGIGARKLTAREQKYFESWRAFGFPREVVRLAYEITVDATGDFAPAYLNKILTEWHKAGVKDLPSAEKETTAHKEQYAKLLPSKQTAKENGKPEFTSFDPGEFFKKAMEKGQKKDG